MPTLIDSLVISVGLDPSKFTKGSKDVQDAYRKTKDEAVKASKQVEESHKRIEQSINKVTNGVLGLFAILMAGRGFKQLIADANEANLALGRFSTQLGVSPKWVTEFEQVVQRVGGSAEEAKAALNSANQAIQDFALGKGVPEAISRMQARVGGRVDFSNPAAYLSSLAPILAKYAEVNAAQEKYFANQLGLSETVNEALIRNGAALQANMDKLSDNAPTQKAIDGAKDLNKAWVDLQAVIQSTGSVITEAIDPPMTKVLEKLISFTERLRASIKWITSGDAAADIGKTTVTADPNAFADHFHKFMSGTFPKAPNLRRSTGRFGAGTGVNPADLPAPGAGERSASFDTSGFMIPGQSSALALKVGSSEISAGNPLPVTIVARGTTAGGFWDWLTGGSGASASSGASDGSGGSGGLIGGIKRFLGGSSSAGSGTSSAAPAITGSAGRAMGGWWTPDKIATAVDYLEKNAGLSHVGALGLVARWASIEAPGGPGSFNHIGKGHYGIGQWDPDRGGLTAGKADFMSQLAHAAHELNTSEKLAASVLRNAKDYGDAARGGAMYERAGGYNSRTGTDSFMISQAALQRAKDAYELHKAGAAQEAAHGKSFDWPVHDAYNLRYGPNQKVKNLRYGPNYGPNTHHLPGHGAGASLSTTGIQHIASTDASVRSMHIGAIHVNAPNATDAVGVAQNIQPVLARNWQAMFANQGPM